MPDDPFSLLGQATSDIFTGLGQEDKAKGMDLERVNYTAAADFAGMNAKISAANTTIATAQAQRQLFQATGRVQAEVGAAGFGAGGSASDVLRMSAQQGAINKAVTEQTGQVQTLGYQEEQKAYTNMAEAAKMAEGADKLAATGSFITGAIKGVTAIAEMMA